jgi:hypothetical protein
MKPSGAHTHPGSGGGLGLAVAVIAAAAVAVPVIGALARLAEVFVITLGAVVVLALAAGTGLAVYRARRGSAPAPGWRANYIGATTVPPAARPGESVTAPRQQAIGQAPEVHVHHHWHGVDAADVAAIIAAQNGEI